MFRFLFADFLLGGWRQTKPTTHAQMHKIFHKSVFNSKQPLQLKKTTVIKSVKSFN